MSRPNPEAIAWYVEEAQRLLEDQQHRAESLRSRGGQLAGFDAAVLALIGGNAATILDTAEGSAHLIVGLVLLIGVVFLAVAVATAAWGVMRPQSFVALGAAEIAVYTSRRFIDEPDLWRVHLRSLHALEKATREIQEDGNRATTAISTALYALLMGLGFSLVALGTLILESI
jgi:hypothetical protein